MKHFFRSLNVHTKLVIASVSILIIAGVFAFSEYTHSLASTIPQLAAGTYCQGAQSYQPTTGPNHVIHIMLENESAVTVANSPDAPFQNSTLDGQCGNFAQTSMHSTTHGSESNYLALTSGLDPSQSTGNDAVANFGLSDCAPTTTNMPARNGCPYGTGMIPTTTPSLFSQIEQQYGASGWKTYADDMPANCTSADANTYATSSTGTTYRLYVARHNPAIYYKGISCSTQVVPSGSWQSGHGALYSDLASGNMPYYSFIVPNEIENGHDPVSVTNNGVTTTIAGGKSQIGNIDSYLSRLLPIIQSSPQYQNGSLVVMITYDEGIAAGNVAGEDTVGEHCADPNVSPLATSCQVKTWIVGRFVPHTTYTSYMNQFGLLGATQRLIGVSPILGHAADSTTPDIVNGTAANPNPFNLANTSAATAPSEPVNVSAAAGNSSATVSFSTPYSSGGSPITNYTVTSNPGNLTATGVSSPITINGLSNNVSYTFTVTATNNVGTGPSSLASAAVTPLPPQVPPAPGNVVASAGNSLVNLSWTAPSISGTMSPVTDYLVKYELSGTNYWTTVDRQSTSLSATITGLSNNKSYDFAVIAVNSGGQSPQSAIATTTPTNELLPDAGFETSTGGWIAFSSGTLTRVGSPVHGGQYSLKVTAPSGTNTGLNGLTQNSVISNSVAGKTYTVSCYVMPTLANTNLYVRFLEYAQNYSSSLKFPITTINALPLNTWSLVQATGTAVNSGERMIPQLYSTSLTTINGGAILFDDCSVTAAPTVTTPSAPTNVTAIASNGSATVNFAAPSTDGGSPITGYTITAQPGGATATTTSASPVAISGLSNGTAYTFTVTATNANGTSPASSPSAAVTPYTLPDAPTNLAVTTSSAQAQLSWSAPLNNGGSPITSYSVGYSVSGANSWSYVTSPSTSTTIPGLTNGVSYDFTVSSNNAAGQSAASQIVSATPYGAPSAPLNVSAVATNGSATVSFDIPNSDGGSPITSYTVTSIPGGITTTGTSSPIIISGLANGTSYTFNVVATNAIDMGSTSQVSNSVTPSTIPDAPQNLQATPGDGQVSLTWNAANNEGSAVTDYLVQYSPTGSGTWTTFDTTSTNLSTVITGLTDGTSYDFTVSAVNANGQGAASTSISTTPAAPVITVPDAPSITAVASGDGQARISFTPPQNNGNSPITSYTVTSNPGNFTVSGSGSPLTIAGLTNGTSYTFTVAAINAAGSSQPSQPSTAVTPQPSVTVPSAPLNAVATAGVTSAVVNFTVPQTNGGSPITSYVVTSSPGGVSATGTSSPITVNGLTANTSYTFTVKAVNGIGQSSASSASNSVVPRVQLLADAGFETGFSNWVAFTSGTLTRVTSPVRTGTGALQIAAPATGNTGLVGMTQNNAMTNTVAGKTYTAACYVMPVLSANLNIQIRFLEYTQNYSSNIHLDTTTINKLPLNTWTLVQVSSVAVNSGERMIPQIYSTNETTATGAIIYDDCSFSSN